MDAPIRDQYIEFVKSCKTLEQVENLETRLNKAYVVPDILLTVISNQKVLIKSDKVSKESQARIDELKKYKTPE